MTAAAIAVAVFMGTGAAVAALGLWAAKRQERENRERATGARLKELERRVSYLEFKTKERNAKR